MARLMADEDFPFPCVVELRALGHDVITSSEAGLKDQSTPDDTVLDAAILAGRAVLTHNRRHFMRLHLDKPGHAGIIVCTVDGDFIALASRIQAALHGVADVSGQLVRVYRPAQ